ncbi:UDP-galactose transporter Gms1 [Friedmanniomyces endolithicus]|nr:UDP-galactose transporter Gms1 [Friedmanniomyces endolithicus]
MPLVDGQRYYISTAVFLNEVIKLAISLSMALNDIARDPQTLEELTVIGLFNRLGREVFTSESWKMAFPAILYTLQNTLQYIGISNMDAATYQMTVQLRIFATALFSVATLGRSLSMRRWLALITLMVGIATVQVPTAFGPDTKVLSTKDLQGGVAFHSPRTIWDLKSLGKAAAGQFSKRSATYEGIDVDDAASAPPGLNARIGLVAVVLACSLSGVASVYSEKVLKDAKSEAPSASPWVRNVQMSFYSIWPALFIGVFFMDAEHIAKTGFFAGYNSVVWLAIISQALGGLVVALVVNNVDSIAQNLTASISIVLSVLASMAFFDFEVTPTFLLGASVVLSATYLYSSTPEDEPQPPSIHITDEKSAVQSYFDLESVTVAGKSPIRNESLSTSRPATPTYERRPKLQIPGVIVGRRGS